MKTKEQYLDDLKKGAARSLENETAAENLTLTHAIKDFLKTSNGIEVLQVDSILPQTLNTYCFVCGTMAQKKESQDVINKLHDITQQVLDICIEMTEKLSEGDAEKFLPRVKEITKNCKLDYVPFKGE